MKTLYYVPMIHSPEELGSLRKSVVETHIRIYGKEAFEKFLEGIETYWEEVNKKMGEAGFYAPKSSSLHVFVDGLPNVEKEMVRKIVNDLIALRLPTYQIISKLLAHGAKVHGTENLQLLLEEHEYYKGLSEGKSGNGALACARLTARDIAIASRIQEVMASDGDIGILFIGRTHDVIGKLPDDFTVTYL